MFVYRYKKWLLLGLGGVCFILLLSLYLFITTKKPPEITDLTVMEFYSADGTKYFELNNNQATNYTPLDDISPYIIDAMITIEDKNFYHHFGINVPRIAKAFFDNLIARERRYGASTITQQYARNLYLSFEKTYKRKIREAYYALLLEANYTKEEILEGYLNTIYFGHGVYGVTDAARYYFDKDIDQISLKEACMLTAIIRAPSYYSPITHPESNDERTTLILDVLLKENKITEMEYDEAIDEHPIIIGRHPQSIQNEAPYFHDLVVKEFESLNIVRDEFARGVKIHTTLDLRLNTIVQQEINRIYSPYSSIQTAVYAIEPQTGEVKAVIGGRNYQTSQFNRAIDGIRQPGSIIKPILYYRALELGFTPVTTLTSEPTTFYLHTEPYAPINYRHQYAYQPITMAYALATSDNIYAVKTHLFLGPEALVETAHRMGISSELNPVPPLALGSEAVKLSEITTAYAHFASLGKEVKPMLIKKVTTLDGEVLYEAPKPKQQILDPDLSFMMNDLLTGMFDRSMTDHAPIKIPVTGYSLSYRLTNQYSAKSGSTDYDNWMIGYNPYLVLGVWTGYDEQVPIINPDENGYSKQLWGAVMNQYFDEPVAFFQPTDYVIPVLVNPITGRLATRYDEYAKVLYFIKGTEPYQ